GALEALGRIAGHGMEAPALLAGLGVVGRHVAAHGAVVGAAVADQDLAVEGARRTRDVAVVARLGRLDAPDALPALGVEGDQPSVRGPDVDLALPEREPASAPARDHLVPGPFRDLGIVAPAELPRLRVDGMDDAEAGRE